ncbi:hypothetical protein [Halogranum rubrum]|uniref:Rpa-associated protein n=1 Tax=Halogranum salarium B-1 TaxID=1210908 RepID=J3JHW3_9EURY|nr:hypothetical protein [Halogranum salarium]EJN61349.1 hypothetical protein HSB1_03900 [Halogranum salarium B-1]
MSSTDSNSSDNGPGRREVAHRLFAAEFDDASLSYSESDEERAPNYVVTPTGARVNRLFAVGVLTEKEDVNEDVLRGRIADPTGAFVTYAGQYQPDEMAYLDRTNPPAFLALTGKARTFEPEDSDRVFTSVRPESLNDVDGDTRDRWVVTTAEATLERIAVFDEALDSDARGEALARELEARGVAPSLASGIPLAIDHYGTTRAYLEAVRQLAVDALEVVTGDREEVRSLDVAPGEGGDVTLGPLPELDLADAPELETPAEVADTEEAEATEATEATEETETPTATTGDAAASTETLVNDSATEAETGEPDEADGTPESSDVAAEPAEAVTTDSSPSMDDADETDTAVTDESSSESTPTDSTDAVAETGDAAASTESVVDTSDDGAAEPAEAVSPSDDGLGDFDDESESGLDDFDSGPDTSTEESDDAGLDDFDDGDAVDSEESSDGMYELPEDERQEVEDEFGTEFSTGSEVDDPGEADIDVPDADDLQAELDEEAEEAEDTPVEAETTEESDDTDAAEAPSAADVDLEAAAVEAMDELDDGDGAAHDAVVAAVVDEYGVDPDAVEAAIQDALMGGQCYEPDEGQLKAI